MIIKDPKEAQTTYLFSKRTRELSKDHKKLDEQTTELLKKWNQKEKSDIVLFSHKLQPLIQHAKVGLKARTQRFKIIKLDTKTIEEEFSTFRQVNCTTRSVWFENERQPNTKPKRYRGRSTSRNTSIKRKGQQTKGYGATKGKKNFSDRKRRIRTSEF